MATFGRAAVSLPLVLRTLSPRPGHAHGHARSASLALPHLALQAAAAAPRRRSSSARGPHGGLPAGAGAAQGPPGGPRRQRRHASAAGHEEGGGGRRAGGALQLQIANPAMILSGIATRYESSTRILMEYVDNSLDSAEQASRDRGSGDGSGDEGAETVVHVAINHKRRSVWIRDNCGGMGSEALSRLVCGIGDSRKKSVPWLNGQFGFGVQAFRAAAQRLVVVSKCRGADAHVLALERGQVDEIAYPVAASSESCLTFKGVKAALGNGTLQALSGARSSDGVAAGAGEGGDDDEPLRGVLIDDIDDVAGAQGTTVLLDQFDPVWFRTLTAESVSAEIQRHFESLLTDTRLVVVVTEKGRANNTVRCEAFDYGTVEGTHIEADLPVGKAGEAVVCRLVVSRKVVPAKRPRFFKKGRCIGAVGETQSFLAVSGAQAHLWSHPNISGYIEVGTLIDPVITRDEFSKTADRDAVYKALAGLEDELQAALDDVLVTQADEKLSELEFLMTQAMAEVNKEEATADRVPDDTEIEVEGAKYTAIKSKHVVSTPPKGERAKGERAKKDRPAPGFRFVHAEAMGDDVPKRSFSAGSVLYINVDHASFKDRLQMDAKGRMRFGHRISAYLANELAKHKRLTLKAGAKAGKGGEGAGAGGAGAGVVQNLNTDEMYDDLFDSVNQVENVLYAKVRVLLAVRWPVR